MSGEVFISYRRTDRPYVERLANHLASAGVAVWFDHEIDTGDRWLRVIKRQIETCAAFVVVMTPEAEDSDMIANEIDFARSRMKPIFPLLLRGEVFFGLRHTQFQDVTGGAMPTARLVQRLLRLVASHDVEAGWAEFAKHNVVGMLIPATVIRLTTDAAYLSVADGVDCLVPLAELSERRLDRPEQAVRVGSEVIAKILELDVERRRISVSIRQANEGFVDGEEHFDPTVYGMPATYDAEDNYLYPEGFDAESGAWRPGFEQQRDAWESRYAKAYERWEAHARQVKNARADNASAGR